MRTSVVRTCVRTVILEKRSCSQREGTKTGNCSFLFDSLCLVLDSQGSLQVQETLKLFFEFCPLNLGIFSVKSLIICDSSCKSRQMTRIVLKLVLRFICREEEDQKDRMTVQDLARKMVRDVINSLIMTSLYSHDNRVVILTPSYYSTSSTGVVVTLESSSPRDVTDGHQYGHRDCDHLCSSSFRGNPCRSSLPDVVSSSNHESLVNIGRNLRNIALSFDYTRNRHG